MDLIHDTQNQCFLLKDGDNKTIGRIDYEPAGDGALYATHTEVDPAREGEGLAGRLLDALCDYCRQNELKVIPVCAYVVRAFQNRPEKYAGVMKAQ